MTVAVSKALTHGAKARDLRLHRQHLGVGRRLRGARRAHLRRSRARRARSRSASSPRPSRTAPGSCRSRATSTTAWSSPARPPHDYPVALVNSVNPAGSRGRRRAAFEICDVLGRAPGRPLPAGRQRRQHHRLLDGLHASTTPTASSPSAPRMFGFQAAGAAPLVHGAPVRRPGDDRHRHPDRQPGLLGRRDRRARRVRRADRRVTDEEILAAYRLLAAARGVFVEPASAACVAGLLQRAAAAVPRGSLVVCTVTGNGLKDPDTALADGARPSCSRGRGRGGRALDCAGSRPGGGPGCRPASARPGAGDVRQPRSRSSTPSGSRWPVGRDQGVVAAPGARVDVGARAPAGCRGRLEPRPAGHAHTLCSRAGRRRAFDALCNAIPHSRGLGSSAAAAVDGAVAARDAARRGTPTRWSATRCWRSRRVGGPRRQRGRLPLGGSSSAGRPPGIPRGLHAVHLDAHPELRPVALITVARSPGPTRGLLPRRSRWPTRPSRRPLGTLVLAFTSALSCCSRPPRTGCTSPTDVPPTPRPRRGGRSHCGRPASPAVVSGGGADGARPDPLDGRLPAVDLHGFTPLPLPIDTAGVVVEVA